MDSIYIIRYFTSFKDMVGAVFSVNDLLTKCHLIMKKQMEEFLLFFQIPN